MEYYRDTQEGDVIYNLYGIQYDDFRILLHNDVHRLPFADEIAKAFAMEESETAYQVMSSMMKPYAHIMVFVSPLKSFDIVIEGKYGTDHVIVTYSRYIGEEETESATFNWPVSSLYKVGFLGDLVSV